MHSAFKVFDAHCDTLTKRKSCLERMHLRENDLKKYEGYIQVFALCSESSPYFLYAQRHIEKYAHLLKKWGLYEINSKRALSAVRFGGILALEGADVLKGRISNLKRYYNKGVRLITLTWNNDNEAASSITAEVDNGLTEFGKKLIQECEKLGIVVDLSHIGDRSFFDACDVLKTPFVCSHSNSRKINPSEKRNITDEQFLKIKEKDGVCGINLFADFLGEKGDIDSVFRHIEHFSSLGGEKNIGIGSDFDGISKKPLDCKGASYMEKIAEELLIHNYTEKQVRGILHDNFYRVFYEILK